jgi:hypothetical protein
MQVTFPTPFNQVPNVVISQHWDKQHQQVGGGETIDEITTTGFTVISGNSAPNYYIEWIAISDE